MARDNSTTHREAVSARDIDLFPGLSTEIQIHNLIGAIPTPAPRSLHGFLDNGWLRVIAGVLLFIESSLPRGVWMKAKKGQTSSSTALWGNVGRMVAQDQYAWLDRDSLWNLFWKALDPSKTRRVPAIRDQAQRRRAVNLEALTATTTDKIWVMYSGVSYNRNDSRDSDDNSGQGRSQWTLLLRSPGSQVELPASICGPQRLSEA